MPHRGRRTLAQASAAKDANVLTKIDGVTGTGQSKALKAFSARSDLGQYGDNALLLFSLELRLGIEDVHGVAASALTDGRKCKSCDLVYVDRDGGRVVVAQAIPRASSSRLRRLGKQPT